MRRIEQSELDEIVRLHGKWLRREPGGVRADLSESDLSGCDLRWSDLSRSDLSGSVLNGSVLSGSVLSDVYGVVLLPVADPRGHSFPHAVLYGDRWMIRSGCKFLSVEDARAYVSGDKFSGPPWLRDQYLYAFDWLEAWDIFRPAPPQPRREG